MKSLSLGRYALSGGVAVALLTGCGGAQPPISALDSMQQMRAHAASSSGGDLLYVSSYRLDRVWVYSYPQVQLVDTLSTGLDGTLGLCSDQAGDVFITNVYGDDIVEYAHGGTTPIATLSEDPSEGSGPRGCAIDPMTGDLAVANSGIGRDVAIFPNAHGTPTYYKPANIYSGYFCGYDSEGDLFVDGTSSGPSSGFAFAELAKGGGTFGRLRLDHKIEQPGAVEWDGKYVTVGSISRESSTIYRVRVSGSKATVVGTTQLNGVTQIGQSLIQSSNVITPYAIHRDLIIRVGSWHYPKSASVKELLRIDSMSLYGVTVSHAPK
jgi:hypothetical protein